MAAIIENKFRIFAAQKTIEGLFETFLSQNNVYAFIGKTTPWTPDDTIPPFPIDSTLNDSQVYFDMMQLKKLNPADCTTVIPRYDWTSNLVYGQYEDDVDLFRPVGQLPFFVMTDQFNVYKCIFNNHNNISFVKPTGTSTNIIAGRDKYLWKYMFSVNESDQLKYLTDSWIPCRHLLTNDGSQQWAVQQAAQNGSIEVIDILDGGSGYGSVPSINIQGDGTGATAIAILQGGVIVNIDMTNKGVNYTYATATVSGSAVLKPIMSPAGGHGSDAARELGASNAMFNIKFVQNQSGIFTTVNDFRRVGMVLNPTLFNSPTLAAGPAYTMTTDLTLGSITGTYQPDDIISGNQSTATGIVIDFDSGAGILRVNNVKGQFIPGETISNNAFSPVTGILQTVSGTAQSGGPNTIVIAAGDSAATNFYQTFSIRVTGGTGSGQQRIITTNDSMSKTVTVAIPWTIQPDNTSTYSIAKIKYPDLQPNSGYILYVENRRPIMRDPNQTEDIKMVVDF
jgi:hypothetical protein